MEINLAQSVGDEAYLAAFENLWFPRLKEYRTGYGGDRHFDQHVSNPSLNPLVFLAAAPKLECLLIYKWPYFNSGPDVDHLFTAHPGPFPHLRKLEVDIKSREVTSLVRAIKNVQELSLFLMDNTGDILRPIATLTSL